MAGLAFDKRGDFRRNGNDVKNHDYFYCNDIVMDIVLSHNALHTQEESEFGDEV